MFEEPGLKKTNVKIGIITKLVLYNIIADPAETKDLSGTEIKTREKLKKVLFQWKNECEKIRSRFQSDKIEIDDTTKEELRALGYIE